MPGLMAPARKAKRGRKRAGAAKKTARKTAKKAAKKARKGTKKAAKKGAKRAGKKTARKGAAKKRTAKKAAAGSATRPKNVALKPRKKDTFSTMDLYDHVAQWNPELPKTQVRQVVDDTLNTVHDAIAKIGKVRLKGIGTIKTKKVPARKGGKLVRNPFTGEMVKQKAKPASKKVKLTAAQDLRKA
jgi:nucleoid DNA-binding protein